MNYGRVGARGYRVLHGADREGTGPSSATFIISDIVKISVLCKAEHLREVR